MADTLTINVKNLSGFTQQFFIFQQPSNFNTGKQVYSNSLCCQQVGDYNATGAMLTFRVDTTQFAHIQMSADALHLGQPSGSASVSRAIDLAPANALANNGTIVSVSPLDLSPPAPMSGVQPGAFRIVTPAYDPSGTYNVGSAVQSSGTTILSSFVTASPSSNVDCAPVHKFYVETGNYAPGTVISFPQASINAALCDFTMGINTVTATLHRDGMWRVSFF